MSPRERRMEKALLADQFTMRKVRDAMRIYATGDLDAFETFLRAPRVEHLIKHDRRVRENKWLRPESYINYDKV